MPQLRKLEVRSSRNSKILHGELTQRTFLSTEFIRETYNCILINFPAFDSTNLIAKVVCNKVTQLRTWNIEILPSPIHSPIVVHDYICDDGIDVRHPQISQNACFLRFMPTDIIFYLLILLFKSFFSNLKELNVMQMVINKVCHTILFFPRHILYVMIGMSQLLYFNCTL